jgi:hypothetical protein
MPVGANATDRITRIVTISGDNPPPSNSPIPRQVRAQSPWPLQKQDSSMGQALQQADRATDVADFLREQAPGSSAKAIMQAVAERWPDLGRDEYLRALDAAIAGPLAISGEAGGGLAA